MSGGRRTSGAMVLGEKLLASYFQSYLSNREESKVNMGRLKPVVEKNQFSKEFFVKHRGNILTRKV